MIKINSLKYLKQFSLAKKGGRNLILGVINKNVRVPVAQESLVYTIKKTAAAAIIILQLVLLQQRILLL